MPSKDKKTKNDTNKAYYHRNKERLREAQRVRSLEEYKNPDKRAKKIASQLKWKINHPEKDILYRTKQRSIREGIPFNLEESDIVIPEYCPILGIKLEFRGEDWNTSPSIDKIIPEKGYVKGNIQIISMRANRIKCDASPEELRLLADFMEQQILEILT